MAFFSRSDEADDAFEDDLREPLLPATWSEALRRRGMELLGLALLALAAVLAMSLGSYDPADPSFFNATSDSPGNWLGLPGATLADPLARTLGFGAWMLPGLAGVWALRFVLHGGEGRIWSRLLAMPPAVLAVSAAFAAHVPPAGWEHPYGLGGLLGDAIGRAALEAAPAAGAADALPLSLGLAVIAGTLAMLAAGVDREETARGLRWMGAGAGWALRGAVVGAAAGAVATAHRLSRPRSEKLAAPEPIGAARREPAQDAPYDDEDEPPLTRGAAAHASAAPPTVLERLRGAVGAARTGAEQDDDEDLSDAHAPRAEAPRPPVSAPKKTAISRRARKEAQPTLALEGFEDPDRYDSPPLTLLENPREIVRPKQSTEALEENARMLEAVLDDYGIRGEIVKVSPGPVVTMYELEPERGVKASRVIGLADDIARSMSALAARVSTVPGRSIIGIELPNDIREKVLLREMFEARSFGDAREKLLLALGKDIAGEPVVANLARMPHLLIAGTTGSGKSVAINTMILSLLYRLSPKECRMIMIDPKMLELSVYDGIPHLLSPVVTDPKKAVVALKWTVAEMEDRYRKMSRMGVRNIEGYNSRVRDALEKEEDFTRTVQTGFCEETGEPVFETQSFEPEEMPFIVVVVDEMADLMMVAGKEIEACIQRLAQMARASGIHLIMATQRPSVDVITGTIKANFPTRISFQVTSKIDSRTILGEQGAEQLLGMGDMLHMAGGGRVSRVHGPFVSDLEVEEIVQHLKGLGEPEYVGGVTDGPDDETASEIDEVLGLGDDDSEAAIYDRAVAIVARDQKCSTSYIQRKLAIGYQRAARLVEQMEEQGVVTPANKVGKREILVGEV